MITLSRKIKKVLPPNYLFWNRMISRAYGELNIHEIQAMKLLSLENPRDLASLLKLSFFKLEDLINYPDYRRFRIPKRRGGYRFITTPGWELKQAQKRLNYFLQARYLCIRPEQVHGFVANPRYLGKSCNIVENAKAHTRRKHLLNIDLQDFFPGISARRVKETFISDNFGFNDHMATALTLLTTFEGSLPVGAPTSPAISNFVCHGLDRDLQFLSDYKHFTYTRYADDITFSANHPFSADDMIDIEAVIMKHQFHINHSKTRMTGSNRKQLVTGLVVNEKVNINRRLMKALRAIVHDCTKNGIGNAAKKHFRIKREIDQSVIISFHNRINGYISFVGQVRGKDDPVFRHLKDNFDKAVKRYYSPNPKFWN